MVYFSFMTVFPHSIIQLGLNPITYTGAMALLKAIEQNEDSVVELLDLMVSSLVWFNSMTYNNSQ